MTSGIALNNLIKGDGSNGIVPAVAGTDYSAGTSGLATGLVYSTTGTGALSVISTGSGSSGQVLTWGSPPTWAAPSIGNLTGPVTSVGLATSITPLAITNSMIANGTIDLTAKVTGILPLANGGTNSNAALTAGGVIYASAGGVSMVSSAAGTVGYLLQSNGSSAPTWVAPASAGVTSVGVSNSTVGFTLAVTVPAPNPVISIATSGIALNNLIKGDGSNGIVPATAGTDYSAGTASLATGLVYSTTSTGALSVISTASGSAGQVLTWGTPPTWAAASAGNLTGPVTSVGLATAITPLAITNAMIANSTIDLTAKVTGVLPVPNGGTGVASFATVYAPVCGGTTTTGALQQASTGMSNSGWVLTSNGSAALPSFQAPGAATVANWTTALSTTAPNTVIPVASWTATNAAASVDAAFVAKGPNGAILGQVPDNAITGGVKRGQQAVDWQMSRTAAINVASGTQACIPGGVDNIASGNQSFAAGNACQALSTSCVAIGASCIAFGSTSVALGQTQSNNGNYSTIAGGLNGTISGGNGCFIGGGQFTQVTNCNGCQNFNGWGVGVGNLLAQTNVSCTTNVDVWLATTTTTAPKLVFYGPNTSGGTSIPAAGISGSQLTLQARGMAANSNYTLPSQVPPATTTGGVHLGQGCLVGTNTGVTAAQWSWSEDKTFIFTGVTLTVSGGGGTSTTAYSCPGAAPGDVVSLGFPSNTSSIVIWYGYVDSNDSVTVVGYNPTAFGFSVSGVTVKIRVSK